MERSCLSNKRCGNRAWRNATRLDFPEIDFDVARPTGERRIDEAAAVQSIDDEFFDLRTRGAAIAADQRRQQCPSVGRYRHSGVAHLLIDQASEIASGIRVTRQRRDNRCALTERTQRRAPSQITRLDDDSAVDPWWRAHQALHGGGEIPWA